MFWTLMLERIPIETIELRAESDRMWNASHNNSGWENMRHLMNIQPFIHLERGLPFNSSYALRMTGQISFANYTITPTNLQ